MHRLLIYLSILQFTQCCPAGYELFRAGQCKPEMPSQFVVAASNATQKAIQICKAHGGGRDRPVIIHYKEDDDYWRGQDYTPIVLGLECDTKTKEWKWTDGSSLDYKPAAQQGDLSAACDPTCAWYIRNNAWFTLCGSIKQEAFEYCITDLRPLPVSDVGDGCYGFVPNYANGMCYQISATQETWSDSHAKCLEIGANFTSIHTQQESEFVRQLAVSNGAVNGVFLGAEYFSNDFANHFHWVDASKSDFNYWQPNFPRDSTGTCLTMDTARNSARWMNTNCEAKLPYVCSRKRADNAPVCSSGPWKQSQKITSPGFPSDASTPCDYIFTVPTGLHVQVQIQFLQANSCCDRLVLYEGENILANLTGELPGPVLYHTKKSNTMKVSWQPNGGVNVRGLQMMFQATHPV